MCTITSKWEINKEEEEEDWIDVAWMHLARKETNCKACST